MKNKNEIKMDRKDYIDFLANQSNEISMSNHNSKTGVACLNIAFPTCTCREDAPCKNQCYACKGRQQICRVQAAYYRNLRLYYDNPDEFFEQVYYKVKFSGLPKVRLFDSGDIPNYDFLVRLVDLCNKTPNVKYGGFTKKYEIVNKWIDKNGNLPENLNIVFSAWHIGWKVINPHNLPVAYVDFKDKTLNPEFPKDITSCPNEKDKTITCSICRKCWNKNIKAVKFTQH